MRILQLTVHFSPNLGGVETHLDDLVSELTNLHNEVFVLTYRPLSVKSSWKMWTKNTPLQVLRLPWVPGYFNKLSPSPVLEFLYLFPGLFLALPFAILFFRPEVIHSHGLVSGFIGVFWGKIFKRKVVISTHSLYHFPKSGLYKSLANVIFNSANCTLCLSNQSRQEIIGLGISPSHVHRFTYWVDLNKFRPLNKKESQARLEWLGQFVVLFVGRLVPEKGIPELLESAKLFKQQIYLKIAGSGPLESLAGKYYVGRVAQSDLPVYYSAADIVIVPSTHDEGFGRVILESLACGTPVIAANRGAIPEAMDNTVGKLITITPNNIAQAINYYASHQKKLIDLSKRAREMAVVKYSKSNTNQIVNAYL